ncbi:F-box/LRR-repeat protein 4 isoform X1 [Spodoptera frugiperda]|uniref:F-box/LRR-repeat protein 4 isoform X1 n=1 Tax=Spodoptera frugiperda TaxID=7108 RepID=A0A9R0F226_SPOFR|nr:F-box/LRR-repeat protein 4 isoform X1 [Spodoptera frugiperda]
MQNSDIISSLFWFKNESEEEDKDHLILEQFVHNVEDFSSQYGSEISVSYTAFNLRGPPSNFPDYGDYPQAFVMVKRTYGTWWEEAPSAQKDYMPQNASAITSQDFVEVSFEKAVYPLEVSIFETYNPGALVRIWALGPTTWMLLWEGEPEYVGDTPRIFSPPIRQINVPTRILRLEFNHKLLPYYTELDAVLLRGRQPANLAKHLRNNFSYSSLFYKPVVEKGQLLNRIIASNLHENIAPQIVTPRNQKQIDTGPPLGDFQQLPDETTLCVMKYLDIQSLCRCAQVNRHFNRLASDCILYRSIDLRPYWHCVQSQVLATLSMRCKFLQKLDLSWCGSHRMIQPNYVVNFLKDSGAELTHLRMNCCKFVDNSVLRAIVDTSTSLQELCLRSVVGCTDWICLSALKKLKRLDLYRTDITTSAAVAIIRSNPGLRHLNVGSCKMISSMDEVAIALGGNCPNLVSVDFWKSYSLTPNGIRALGNCKKLQELDVGWCLQAGGSGEWLGWLSVGELRKLFLGALRGVCDRDLRSLIPRAPKLAQLDLLGVRAVTADICDSILAECKDLRLLDVSFCDQIQEAQVVEWREQYPHVSIKRSFQSANLNTAPNPLFLAPSLE